MDISTNADLELGQRTGVLGDLWDRLMMMNMKEQLTVCVCVTVTQRTVAGTLAGG